MLLAREFIGYLARQLVERLSPAALETSNPAVAAGVIAQTIEEDLSIEDRLNDEVRDLLDQYSDYMRRENVSYQEMFRKIKNQLLSQRKVIRAAGRDTGDPMKLSRDKVNDLAHKKTTTLPDSDLIIDKNVIAVGVPASLLPSTGLNEGLYRYAYWPEDGLAGSTNIASFAPEFNDIRVGGAHRA